jgi:alkylation response protein AidB-like acyl-CoA dehydrogenase
LGKSPLFCSAISFFKSYKKKERKEMNFQPNEITQHAAQTAKDFAQQYIKPHVMEWDESQEFPVQCFKEMGKLGLMGILVPHEYGGCGLS